LLKKSELRLLKNLFVVEKKSLSYIARELGIHRHTVRKYIDFYDLRIERILHANSIQEEEKAMWSRGKQPVKLLGKKYGMLTVNEYVDKISEHIYEIKCTCDCGRQLNVNSKDLILGYITSCGCQPELKHPRAKAMVMVNGEEMSLYQLAQEMGVPYRTMLNKLLYGWEIEDIIAHEQERIANRDII
jgi:DNA-binding CsgD family transcriptional regulator